VAEAYSVDFAAVVKLLLENETAKPTDENPAV
jgi:hypothetical protein